jgi:hypothetical protein
MIRLIVFFYAFLISITYSFSQNNSISTGSQASDNLNRGNDMSYGSSMTFYNPKRFIEGTYHLFENWNNTATIYTISDEKFLVKRINLNLTRNSFEAKISDSDSIFSFTFNNIEKIIINNKTYKNYYYNDNNRVYEMLFDTDKYKFLKGFKVKLITGSANPMVNRPNDKYVRGEEYFIMINGSISPLKKLKKKFIYKLLDLNNLYTSKLDAFIELNLLSLKKEEDIVKLLDYYNSI